MYRFSIDWSRVLPNGDTSTINEKGIEYYNRIIDKLIELNVEPMVTIFHHVLPQKLEILGGFTNSIIVKYFEAYANLLFERFGDRVKYWITLNEPSLYCLSSYGFAVYPPGVAFKGVGQYLCGHNTLKSHAVAYHLYRNKFYERFNGQVGITSESPFYYSRINNTNDVENMMQFHVRSNRIFVSIFPERSVNSFYIFYI